MNVVIIEDEHFAAVKLKNELAALDLGIQVVAELDTCQACIDFFNHPVAHDLIFSDIHLADGLCFNAYQVCNIEKPIIFTTAYDKYALEAFETNGIDYLLKPIHSDRLLAAINKYKSLGSTTDQTDLYAYLNDYLSDANKQYKSRFLCKLGNKIKSISVSQILYFYSKEKMTFLVDKEHNRYPVNHTLDEIDKMMDPSQFFKLNRQFVTHFDAIHEIHPYFKGRLKIKLAPATDEDIIVSTERSPLMKAWLDR